MLSQATVVNWKALADTVLVSLAAGVGVTLAYSLAVFGAIRFVDLREERPLAAASAALLVVTMAILCVGAVVLGIVVMLSK